MVELRSRIEQETSREVECSGRVRVRVRDGSDKPFKEDTEPPGGVGVEAIGMV